MVTEVFTLQVAYGACFASARTLAARGDRAPKTWHRLLEWLKEHDLVEVERLYRANGTRSVNLIDARKLWALVLQVIAGQRGVSAAIINRLTGDVKVGAFWVSFAEAIKKKKAVPDDETSKYDADRLRMGRAHGKRQAVGA